MGQAEKTVKLWKKPYINSSPSVAYILFGDAKTSQIFLFDSVFLGDSIAHVISWFNDFSR